MAEHDDDPIDVDDLVAAQEGSRPWANRRVTAVTATVVAAGAVAGAVAIGVGGTGGDGSPAAAPGTGGTGQSSAPVTVLPPSAAPSSTPASGLAGGAAGPKGAPGDVGQAGGGTTGTAATPAGPPAPAASATPAPVEHVVAAGESLWAITQQALGDRATAAKIMDSWPAIYDANRSVIGGDPNLLRPGQKLIIPALA